MTCTATSLPFVGSPLLACGVALMLAGCSKESAKPAATTATTAPVTAQVEAELLNTLDTPQDLEGKALDDAMEEFKRGHPFATAEELLKLPAFAEKLGTVLRALAKDQRLMDQVNQRVQMAADIKGVQGDGSNRHLDLKVDNYTPERTDRLLSAVLSGKPQRLVEFVTTEIDEASVQFTLAPELERASNGMTIRRDPPPPPKP